MDNNNTILQYIINNTGKEDNDRSIIDYIDSTEESEKKLDKMRDVMEERIENAKVNANDYIYYKQKPKHKEYRISRNDKCPCGSGEKYKNCCLKSGKYEGYNG